MLILKKDNAQYFEQINLLASKIVWLKKNERPYVLLLAGLERESLSYLAEDLYHTIAKQGLKVSLSFLCSNDLANNDIDWDHELNIIYLDDTLNNPHLASVASFIDSAILVVNSAFTKRSTALKAVELLKRFGVKVSGSLLHNYKEKVPSLFRRIFF